MAIDAPVVLDDGDHNTPDDTVRTLSVRPEPARHLDAQDAADWTPRIIVTIDDAVEQVHQRDEFMSKVMRKDLDYGVIPGTGTKPTLLKPGAERLLSSYGLHPELVDEEPPTLDLSGADHGGEPFILYRRVCRVWRQTGPGERDRMLIAQASGACSSWETKYRYRTSKPACPNCGGDLRKSKQNPEFYCWIKENGCGATFGLDDARIEGGGGKIANPDPAEQLNTILKMADKRALVAATIIATGWSDIVTQDVEDTATGQTVVSASEPNAVAAAAGRPAPKPVQVVEHRPAPSAPQPNGEAGERAVGVGSLCGECLAVDGRGKGGQPSRYYRTKFGTHQCNGYDESRVANGLKPYLNHLMPPQAVSDAEREAVEAEFGSRPIPF